MLFIGLSVFLVLIFVSPQEFIPGIKGLPLVSIVMQIVGLVWILRASSKKVHFIDVPQNKMLICLFISIIISTFTFGWLKYTFDVFIEWVKVILIYFLIINILDSFEKLKKTILVIVLSMLFTAGMGVLQYYGYDITGIGTLSDGRIRGIGIFATNQLAYSAAFCVPFVFFMLSMYKNILIKCFFIFVLCIYSLCIYLTQSRGGAICLIAVLFFMMFNSSSKKFVKIMAVILAVACLKIFSIFSMRLATISQFQEDGSAMNRLYVWGQSLSTLKNHFLTGIGKNLYIDNFGMAAHSSYIEVLSELGVVGLFCWLALFYFSIRNLRFINKFSVDGLKLKLKFLSEVLMASIFAYLIGSLFSSSSYYITLYIIFSLIAVLQYHSGEKCLQKCSKMTINDIALIGFIECTVIIGLHIWVKFTS